MICPTNAAIKRLFPGYRKKQFMVSFTNNPTQNTASYWDGGSRDEYTVRNLRTGQSHVPPAGIYPTYQAQYTLQPGEILVSQGTFCGKPATLSITALESDRTAILGLLGLDPLNPNAAPPIAPPTTPAPPPVASRPIAAPVRPVLPPSPDEQYEPQPH